MMVKENVLKFPETEVCGNSHTWFPQIVIDFSKEFEEFTKHFKKMW